MFDTLMDTAEARRLAYLDAMGVQAWRLRLCPPGWEAQETPETSPAGESMVSAVGTPSTGLALMPENPPSGEAMGTPSSSLALTPENPSNVSDGADAPSGQNLGTIAEAPKPACDWDGLQAQVAACTACPLHQNRTQTVFGVGGHTAHWMVIGEAPGEQEDLQGEPFVGRAGLLLNEMLRAIGLERERVYIANILKCRPPKNRDPQAEETAACEGFLKQQLAFVKPRIILAVGRIAAQNLLKTTTPIGKLRGSVHDYQGVPLVVTYHPAYLLRSPLEKRKAFDDLRLALHTYRKTL